MARKDARAWEEKKVLPPLERPCDYCGGGAVGNVNGRSYCREHAWSAMDGVSPNAPRIEKRMEGVLAKPVAGS